MKKPNSNLKRTVFGFLVLAFAVMPISSSLISTAHAATTTTKYLNGKIVFDSDRDGNSEIYTMNADGGSQTRLTSNVAFDFNATLSSDGTKIAFQTNRDGNSEIYTMNADGGSQTNVSNDSSSNWTPAWSPDGTKIAFRSNRDDIINEIYTMNADGSNVTRLTNNPAYESAPAWSPDGTKIAFISTRDGGYEIYTMNANGSGQTRITNNSFFDGNPAWSPDGTKIAFISDRDGPSNPYNSEIYTMNANDGSNVVRITNTLAVEDAVSYSPDGKKLVMTAYSDQGFNSSELFTTNLDGSNRIQLTSGGTYNESYSPQIWQKLPYTVTTQDNGTIVSTIPSTATYASTDYTVVANETLVLDGTLCDVTVKSGGTLLGTGTIAPNCTLTVEPGGVVGPGHSPGCLTSGTLALSGTYSAELAGTTACSSYDQLQVTGTVTLSPTSTLTPTLLNNFMPKAGDSFTIITNDGTDAVTGTFTGLPEGSTITIGSSLFKISYVGGDGNDVSLTAVAVPGSPNTGVNSQSNVIATIILSVSVLITFLGFLSYLAKRITNRYAS